MGSLRSRILASMLAVSLLTALVTGVIVRQQTIGAVEEAARVDLRLEQDIFERVLFYGAEEGTWDGLGFELDELASSYDTRIAVTTFEGRVLADSEPGSPLPESPRTVVDPAEDLFALFGFDDGFEFDECLFEAGVRDEVLDGSIEPSDAELDALADCSSALVIDLEPVLLYIGHRADELVDLGTLDVPSLLLALAAVVGVAAALAYLVSARVSGPVRRLIAATTDLGRGDLDQRVEVGGSGDVARLGTAFNDMTARLRTSETARARMVSDAAHELRNPVGVLLGNLEAAQDRVFPVDDQLIDLLHGETAHLARLLDDLEQLARADAGALALDPEPTDLAELIGQVELAHRPVAQDRGITLTSDLRPATLVVDPTRIKQVVTNVVTNGIHYTDPGGSVELALAVDGDQVVITVSDDGVGLTAEEQALVFDRFWRADRSRSRHTGGAGIGLSICKELVEAHGGTIGAASGPGPGTTVTIRLPAPS